MHSLHHPSHDGDANNGRTGFCNPVNYFIKSLKVQSAMVTGNPLLALTRKEGNCQGGNNFRPGLRTGSRDDRELTPVRGGGFTGTHPIENRSGPVPRLIPCDPAKGPSSIQNPAGGLSLVCCPCPGRMIECGTDMLIRWLIREKPDPMHGSRRETGSSGRLTFPAWRERPVESVPSRRKPCCTELV